MSTTFRPYLIDQAFLLPPDVRDWLPKGHLALFISDVVDSLNLSAIFSFYDRGDGRGMPAFHPTMMVKLLIYGYCTGKVSSRKIERATHEEVPFRVLAANQHPDHDTVANFRKQHLPALAAFFKQVLRLAEELGLVKLGNVALDGTKVKANASKHKAMSYQRMVETEARLQQEVDALLAGAEQADAAEDAQYGKGKRGDELPAELARRDSRLVKIREAKAALEQQAKERAEVEAEAAQRRIDERRQQEVETGKKAAGRDPQVHDPKEAKPEPKAQRNFTDPESRIMKDGASKGFEQCYNAQAAVDGEHQIIVAADVTQHGNDQQELVPMMAKVKENMGRLPDNTLADSGYYSEANVTHPDLVGTNLLVPPNRQKHGAQPQAPSAAPDTTVSSQIPEPMNPNPAKDPPAAAPGTMLSVPDRMRKKLAEAEGKTAYALRKTIVEPVFGQIKQGRGFRRFSFRGLANVTAEWQLVCATHNLLKIFRSGKRMQAQPA